jgi:hypothetical protein
MGLYRNVGAFLMAIFDKYWNRRNIMNFIKRVMNDWFTGPDGETHDPARFLWFLGVLALLVYTGFDIARHDKLNLEEFAFAYSSLLAAGAAGVRIKETSEPKGVVPPIPVVPAVPTKPASAPAVPVSATDDDDDMPRPPKG